MFFTQSECKNCCLYIIIQKIAPQAASGKYCQIWFSPDLGRKMAAFWACACKLSWTLFSPAWVCPWVEGRRENRSFAGSSHVVRNKVHWDANNAVGRPKQRNSYQSSPTFLCFESPTVIYSVPSDRILQRAYSGTEPRLEASQCLRLSLSINQWDT